MGQEILFEEVQGNRGNLGIITLNRPEALNALNHTMVLALEKQLTLWENAAEIKAVVIRPTSGSRAFCAGGDLRFTYDHWQNGPSILTPFFRDEYKLNRHIFHYPKPYIALLDGITMGGGVGISIHGSHRVATERLLFAMPETGIGFFPDVGGTYFLPRLPDKIGFYLGLVGARIKSADCCAIGLAQHYVASTDLTAIVHSLAEANFGLDPNAAVTQVLNQFQVTPDDSTLLTSVNDINKVFAKNSMEEILTALTNLNNTWSLDTQALLNKKSPTSLKVTLHQLHEGKKLDFDSAMDLEYRLVNRFLQGHDFREGIRAVIIDKDQKPLWRPNSLEGVSAEAVEQYFLPVNDISHTS